jgi:hypothetical protein
MSNEEIVRIGEEETDKGALKAFEAILKTFSPPQRAFHYLIIMTYYGGNADFAGWDVKNKTMRRAFRWMESKKLIKKDLSGVYSITKDGKKFYERMKKTYPHWEPTAIKILEEDD